MIRIAVVIGFALIEKTIIKIKLLNLIIRNVIVVRIVCLLNLIRSGLGQVYDILDA